MIEVLSPFVANQIAAGEVVQRPASIIKELMENAVDAGANRVIVSCVDGGRTMIRVIDDGVGMSVEDAPRAFLRHATSKIRSAEDLFHLRSFGFRGEALASIASVAQVEMRTRRSADDLGTLIELSAGEITNTEAVDAPRGTSITVRNLFYNIPARRKFLKSDRSETAAVFTEFQRVAMVNPELEFEFHNNLSDKTITLASGGLHQRIVGLTKSTFAKRLLPLDLDTELVRLSGYVGTPDTATAKSGASQFFFVNGRFVRSPFLQKAVIQAYDRLIGSGSYPSYFLFLELSPSSIDVNINPTKTEVKFDDEQSIFQTIHAAVKACLGRSNVVQAIDFDAEAPLIDIPAYTPIPEKHYTMPAAHSGRAYNPFTSYDTSQWEPSSSAVALDIDPEKVPFMEMIPSANGGREVFKEVHKWIGFQMFEKYIVMQGVEGLTIINIPRARQRIAYEKILSKTKAVSAAQYLIAPVELDIDELDRNLLIDNIELIESVGFVLSIDEQNSSWELHAVPSGLDITAFDSVLEALRNNTYGGLNERMAEAATRGLLHSKTERMVDVSPFVNELLSCDEPSFTPSGLPIIEIIELDELEKRMK